MNQGYWQTTRQSLLLAIGTTATSVIAINLFAEHVTLSNWLWGFLLVYVLSIIPAMLVSWIAYQLQGSWLRRWGYLSATLVVILLLGITIGLPCILLPGDEPRGAESLVWVAVAIAIPPFIAVGFLARTMASHAESSPRSDGDVRGAI